MENIKSSRIVKFQNSLQLLTQRIGQIKNISLFLKKLLTTIRKKLTNYVKTIGNTSINNSMKISANKEIWESKNPNVSDDQDGHIVVGDL